MFNKRFKEWNEELSNILLKFLYVKKWFRENIWVFFPYVIKLRETNEYLCDPFYDGHGVPLNPYENYVVCFDLFLKQQVYTLKLYTKILWNPRISWLVLEPTVPKIVEYTQEYTNILD